MKRSICIAIFVIFYISSYSQDLGYNIFGTYGKPVHQVQLNEAKTMNDINSDYPSSWIKESDYVSSEIKIRFDGNALVAAGENNILNLQQREVLRKADIGSNINIEVKYKTENSVTHKIEIKTMSFSVSLIPETEAAYPGGEDMMKEYLKWYAADKINASGNNKFEAAKVRFVVNEEGAPSNPEITTSSEHDEIDQLLLQTITNMPKWNPATNANGNTIKQEFEFVVGVMIGC